MRRAVAYNANLSDLVVSYRTVENLHGYKITIVILPEPEAAIFPLYLIFYTENYSLA